MTFGFVNNLSESVTSDESLESTEGHANVVWYLLGLLQFYESHELSVVLLPLSIQVLV